MPIKPCIECGNNFYKKNNCKLCPSCSKKRDEYRARIKTAREIVFRRDEYRCVYCGMSSIEHGVSLHIDHVYPKSMGGGNELFNLVTSCESCNMYKAYSVLPESIIGRIWARNKQLNLNLKTDYSYKELMDIFNIHFAK